MRFSIIFLSALAAYAQSEPLLRSGQSDAAPAPSPAPTPKPVSPPVQAAAPLTSQLPMDAEPMPEDFNPGGFGACYLPAGRALMEVHVGFGRRWGSQASAPYSALVVTVEAPPPGSPPYQSQPQSRMNWRDSAGRVRIEMQGQTIHGDCPNILVQIEDPVAGYAYVLDTLQKIAHRIPVHFCAASGSSPAAAPHGPARW
jgi:hypothetical protein